MDDSIPTLAKIRLEIPEQKWISEIFRKYSDIELEIKNFFPCDFENSIGNAIIEIWHYNINNVIEDIRGHNSVFEFSVLEKEENRAKINIKTNNPYLLYGAIKFGVLIEFPVRVKDRFMEWRLVSTRERIDKLLTLFEEKNINFSLIRIGSSSYRFDDEKNKISLPESKILNTAISLGFFEVPRKISLESLANKLGKSKSWTSELLRKIIQKKIQLEI